MRTPIRLWLLLSGLMGLFAVSAMAQVPASTSAMRVDPAMQRERDITRMSILQDELAKESRELANAENAQRIAQASRVSADKLQEAATRILLHRQNVAALMREIALVKKTNIPDANRGEVKEVETRPQERQPDDWLIFRSQVPAVDRNVVPNVLLRRRLPLAESGNTRPQWIIPSGYTGIGP